ncbi:DUF2505 domain-containing protein [Solicola sp. PLA-1-18]|uniref:DUF2505 domain-containing protein n=1 Tax=Solicola sp. PLA-1-18 TaxID=3380532 RepID=UPI003B76DEFE
MKIEETVTYPGATPEAVFALISDEGFRTDVCDQMNATRREVTVTSKGEAVTVTISRTIPAALPDALKKIVGDTVSVDQVETWDAPDAGGDRTGRVTVDIKGQPASMKGTTTLAAKGDDTVLTVVGDVSVKIPFIGKKVEPEVAKAIVQALRLECREGNKRL